MNPMCGCGCGKEVKKPTHKFLIGHYIRTKETSEKQKLSYKKRTGFDHPMHNPTVLEQLSETFKNRTQEERLTTKLKTISTCLKKYNVESINQLPEIKEKKKITNIKKTGFENPSQSQNIKDKKIETRSSRSTEEKIQQRKNYQDGWNKKTNIEIEEINQKRKETLLNLYNVDNIMQMDTIKEKVKITNIDRYGGPSPLNCDLVLCKIKKTCLERYNETNPSKVEQFKEKSKQTCLEHFGVEHPMQNKEILNQSRLTYKTKTGFDHPLHNPEVLEKSLKNSFRRKEYILPSGKKILLQGEEPSFLDYIFSNNLLTEEEIIYKPRRIKYLLENKEHYYFADFYIPKFNLIVEIKSWYVLSIQKGTDEKIAATKALGHNYIMILDKKYDDFKNLLSQLSE